MAAQCSWQATWASMTMPHVCGDETHQQGQGNGLRGAAALQPLRSQLAVQGAQSRKIMDVLPRPVCTGGGSEIMWGWVHGHAALGPKALQQPVRGPMANRQMH